jgi:hypothetical protein
MINYHPYILNKCGDRKLSKATKLSLKLSKGIQIGIPSLYIAEEGVVRSKPEGLINPFSKVP